MFISLNFLNSIIGNFFISHFFSSVDCCENQKLIEMSNLRQRATTKAGPLQETISHEEKHKQHVLQEAKRFIAAGRLDYYQIVLASLFDIIVFTLPYFGFSFFSKFYTLQYKYPNTNVYDIGLDDSFLVLFWIVNLMFLRSLLITFVFKPMAKFLDITSFKATQRFIEQWWSIIYYSNSWCSGMYLYYNSDYFFNCYNVFSNWPDDQLSYLMKLYYLIQTASWFQQFIILHLEAKRKDHYQMLSHHIVTILLITGSYRYYFTRIGHIILLMMDIVDVTLSFAKILKYSGFQTLCDIMFIVFMFTWIISRHGFYNYMLYYTYKYSRDIMDMNCSKFIDGSFYKACYTDFQIDFFVGLLSALQVIMCIWMYMILKVAVKVITGGYADDIRSDDGSD